MELHCIVGWEELLSLSDVLDDNDNDVDDQMITGQAFSCRGCALTLPVATDY